MFLLWLVTVWTAAAFGEEMFFRGYLVTRLQTVFSDVKFGIILAVLVPVKWTPIIGPPAGKV